MKNHSIFFPTLLLSLLIVTSCRKDIGSLPQEEDPAISMSLADKTSISALLEATSSTKVLKVNVYRGENPFKNSQWNNWNTSASLTTGDLRYADGSSSTVDATLSDQLEVAFNGNDYRTNMAPVEVTRYASYSSTARTLTLSGLDNAKTYDLDIYASRSGISNNITRFITAGKSIDIKTDNNLTTTATFSSLKPSAGKIVVNIKQLTRFNYINGFILVQKGTSTSNTSDGHILTAPAGENIYLPNAGRLGWKGGDTIRIMAGTYATINLGNFHGNATKPVVIMNHGGQVKARRIIIDNASYFKLAGTGAPTVTYGFVVASSENTGVGIGLAHHVEVCNVEVSGTEAGFLFKKNPNAAEPQSLANNFLLSHFNIHHNYLHDIKGEGMYIGHTSPDGDPDRKKLIPVRMDKVEIAYNIVNNVGWDGIQLSNARSDAKIHHNTVTNYGLVNKGSQQAGIIMGGNTTGDIYDNVVKKGTGNGIQAFGYGTIRIYNNTVEDAGGNGTKAGVESIFCNDLITKSQKNPKQQIIFNKNTIKYPKAKGGLRVGAYKGNSVASTITNNTVYLPNAKNNWQKFYLVTHVPGSTVSDNMVVR